MTLTVGSLFSGVGMFDYAFAAAGFDVLFQVEIDTYCQKVLKKHAQTYWPNAKIHADVCRVGRDNLPYVDVIVGGFPCQDISVGGHGAGIQHGTRSGLWYEFKRIIGEIRPCVVLLENVAAILRSEGIKVLSDLTALGYDCRWGIISAEDVGAPHLRERWWCVAVSNAAYKGLDRRDGQQRDHAKGRDSGTLDHGIRGDDGHETEHTSRNRLHECKNSSLPVDKGFLDRRFSAIKSVSLGYETQSRLGRSLDGTSARLDRPSLVSHVFPVGPDKAQPAHEAPRMAVGNKNTNARLKALGNGGMPQIVYPIALEIKRLLEEKLP